MSISISVKVTVPQSILNDKAMRAEIENALRGRTGPDLLRNFKKTTEGWTHQPTFTQKMSSRPDSISVSVSTTDRQYGIVNAGSPPHTITPRAGGMLRFQPGYRAATSPRMIGSSPKQRSGATVAARRVSHPGFTAREFDEAIAEEITPRFTQDVQDAIARAASR